MTQRIIYGEPPSPENPYYVTKSCEDLYYVDGPGLPNGWCAGTAHKACWTSLNLNGLHRDDTIRIFEEMFKHGRWETRTPGRWETRTPEDCLWLHEMGIDPEEINDAG